MHRYIQRDSMLFSRIGMGIGSLLWAVHLLRADPLSHEYTLLHYLAPLYVWAALFALHSLCSLYTVWFNALWDRWAFIFDGTLGFVLWNVATLASYSAYWPARATFYENLVAYSPPAFLSAQVVVAAYAWWRFILLWAECDGVGSHGSITQDKSCTEADHD